MINHRARASRASLTILFSFLLVRSSDICVRLTRADLIGMGCVRLWEDGSRAYTVWTWHQGKNGIRGIGSRLQELRSDLDGLMGWMEGGLVGKRDLAYRTCVGM